MPDAGERAVSLLSELVAIPSVTGSEEPVLAFLERRYASSGWIVDSMEVAPDRRNLFVHRGHPSVVLTTHADTVPPFFPPRREGDVLMGRGACDAKASLAAQAIALEELARDGTSEVGLLVLVGEERGSDGALAANRRPHLARYLVGGEPTGSRFVAGSKGCLRIEVEARGVSGHSSEPSTGRSAVDPLLEFLNDLRAMKLPEHPTFGATTMNIGVLQAGTAPNVIAESARAEIIFRTGEPIETLLAHIRPMAQGRVDVRVGYRSDPVSFRCPKTSPGEIVSFACDLPLLPAWGEPILFGPGSIRDAHGAEEKVSLAEVASAVGVYVGLVRGLLSQGEACLAPR
ncbi:MAG TPA: M20/M25/M40 family metallo-hydrolase [Thermoanaerobaculia bacterium]|jgi:acetylornithine deacetylase|nr:M20/M25/M40 family metallo-hydrolase [Thermoanaerobaculia bacterium]